MGALLRWERLPKPSAHRVSQPRPFTRARRLPGLLEELSAKRTLNRSQVVVLRFAGAAIFLAAVVNLTGTSIAAIALVTALYVSALVYRARLFGRALNRDPSIVVSDTEARRLWDRSLPTYMVLVPAFQESEMMGRLVGELDLLDYPRDRLHIKLLLEEDDKETIEAALAAVSGPHFEIVRLPFSLPRTKPKALNYGLSLARGRRDRGLVTIYDVEDRPEPLQLRRAVGAFRRLPRSVACLQAKLGYYNPDQNVITRWFTIEYAMWFSHLLPGLVTQSAPIPLGGTSNHFRRDALEAVGAWDPHNVTEDADLGIRLHRAGYRTGILESTTLEEANSDFVNWVKQRSRWYKGYMQTWLVHMRHPVQLWRDLGLWGFIGFNLFVGGTPLLALINPVFWGLTVAWFLGRPEFIVQLFPSWLYYISLLCLVFGNFAFAYAAIVAARATGRPGLVLAAAISPAYWVMMSIAAIKAALQLGLAPSFWEKTFHGLDRSSQEAAADRAAA
jgi:cellulose synthase/poly-beta-1,6-N-acetylglucosamine synthase-like glycosyltransferase